MPLDGDHQMMNVDYSEAPGKIREAVRRLCRADFQQPDPRAARPTVVTRTAALRTDPQPATARLGDFVRQAVVDETVLRLTGSVLLDTVAVTLAGGAEPGVQALARAMDTLPGAVPSFWSDAAYRADDAATLFGMASHVLDYDDVSMLTVCHPTVPVFAALLPLAWTADVPGRELLEALAVGSEVTIRLGQAMGFRHYALGFHATGTLGAVGAAAGCARLLRLDARQTANALAIAASMSSGLQKNFGSMVKSLHVGLAAANGLRAARWAAGGIVGAGEPLESGGFLHASRSGRRMLSSSRASSRSATHAATCCTRWWRRHWGCGATPASVSTTWMG
jgi:2-methylcitrate dehydratase PrpD